MVFYYYFWEKKVDLEFIYHYFIVSMMEISSIQRMALSFVGHGWIHGRSPLCLVDIMLGRKNLGESICEIFISFLLIDDQGLCKGSHLSNRTCPNRARVSYLTCQTCSLTLSPVCLSPNDLLEDILRGHSLRTMGIYHQVQSFLYMKLPSICYKSTKIVLEFTFLGIILTIEKN